MNGHLVFAASPDDAKQTIERFGLDFNETVWVMNAQLLGNPADFLSHQVHYSELFQQTPAYVEAKAIFGV